MNRSSETPLHVVALRGCLEFAEEILLRMPELAGELDSRGSSPLHLATKKGYVNIVKILLLVSPAMCLACDLDGKNPLHLAAMKDRIEVLLELVRARPFAAYATTIWCETILHVCVKHNQLEKLKSLTKIMDDPDILNAKDDYGMTILHLAVANKQFETVNYLLMNTRVEVNALNTSGYRALDILAQSRRDVKDLNFADSLRGAGTFKATEIQSSVNRNNIGAVRNGIGPFVQHEQINRLPPECLNLQQTIKMDWLTRKRDSLMVVASLIATMAFQAGPNHPGSLWQDDSQDNNNNNTAEAHQAGTSIIAYKYRTEYSQYLAYNTTGFIASLSIILLLINGVDCYRLDCNYCCGSYLQSFKPKQEERVVSQVMQ